MTKRKRDALAPTLVSNHGLDTQGSKGAGPTADRKSAQPPSVAPLDGLRLLLFPTTSRARAHVFDKAREWIDKLDQVYPKLRAMCGDTFRRALDYDDLDLAHLIFFLLIPQIKPLVDDLTRTMPPNRYARFVAYLTHCRGTLMDGLGATGQKCPRASDVHFAALRHFVWDVRRFYLLGSDHTDSPIDGPRRRARGSGGGSGGGSGAPTADRGVGVGADGGAKGTTAVGAVEPRTAPPALWNHVEAYRFPHVGDAYFTIMAIVLQNALCEEYSNHPYAKRGRYTDRLGIVETVYEPMTPAMASKCMVNVAAHARTPLRDLPDTANQLYAVRIRLHRPTAPHAPTIPIMLEDARLGTSTG